MSGPLLTRLAALLITFASFGCGVTEESCGPSNCAGCCDAENFCVDGTRRGGCGTGGATCRTCADGDVCASHVCSTPVVGGGSGSTGGGSATGGGAASGGGDATGGGAATGGGGAVDAGNVCVPDCTGRQCGSDGCSGTCGACADGICGASGTCTAQQAWSHQTQERCFTRPAIGPSGTIYTACRDQLVYAFTPSGAVKWTFDGGARFDEATIVVSNTERIYVTSEDGKLHCLSSAGQQLWTYDLITSSYGGALDANDAYWDFNRYHLYRFASNGAVAYQLDVPDGIQNSPVIDAAGSVFLPITTGVRAVGGGKNWTWRLPAGLPVNSRPQGISLATGKVLVTVGETATWTGHVYALDSTTGQQLWSWDAPGYLGGSVSVDTDGTVYVTVRTLGMYALDATGHEKWHHAEYASDDPMLIGNNGVLYHADSQATALSSGGALLWRWPGTNTPATYEAIALGNGRLYVPGVTRNFVSLDVSSTGLKSAPWPKARHDARNTGCIANN